MAQPKVQSKNITPTRNMLGMAGLSRALEEDGIALESRSTYYFPIIENKADCVQAEGDRLKTRGTEQTRQ